MKQVCLAVIILIIFSALSCSRGSSTTTDDPFLQLNKQTVTLKGTISTDTVHVSSNVGWTVTKDGDASWLNAEPSSGNGDGDIIITTTDTNLSQQRSANIEIKTTTGDKTATVIVNQSIFSGLIKMTVVGGENDDELWDLTRTDDGGYLAVGNTTSFSGDGSGNTGAGDIWIVKFDSSGNKLWHKCYSDPQYEYGGLIRKTSAGNYIITGYILNFDNGTNGDALLICIDADGNLLWRKIIGGAGEDLVNNIKPAGDGNFFLVGSTPKNGGKAGWVVKINEHGDVLWSRTYTGETITDIEPTPNGGYIFSGRIFNKEGDASDKPEGSLGWLVSTDIGGAIEHKMYLPDSTMPSRLLLTTDGSLLCAGWTTSPVGFGEYHGSTDAFLCKISADGSYIWKRAFGGSGYDLPEEIVTTQEGKIVLIGFTKSGDGDISSNAGKEDGWFLMLDGEGQKLSSLTFGGPEKDAIYDVSIIGADKFAVVGRTESYAHNYTQLDNKVNGWFGIVNTE